MSDNDNRYHKKRWKGQAKAARALTRDRCCICLGKAKQVHHAYYGLRIFCFTLPIAGFEIPGWQLFPLCEKHHSNSKGCAHNNSNYYVEKASNWRNCNTSAYLWRLRIGFLTAASINVEELRKFVLLTVFAVFLFLLWLFAPITFAGSSSPEFSLRQFQPWQREPNQKALMQQRRKRLLRMRKGLDRARTQTRPE